VGWGPWYSLELASLKMLHRVEDKKKKKGEKVKLTERAEPGGDGG